MMPGNIVLRKSKLLRLEASMVSTSLPSSSVRRSVRFFLVERRVVAE